MLLCDVMMFLCTWCAPKLLKKPKGGSQNENNGRKKKVGARSLTHNTLGLGGCVEAPGWD